MRWLILGLALAFGINTAVLGAIPFTSILSAGMWVTKERKRVYEIEVESYGRTFDDAKTAAFKVAVEQAVGSLLLSETEVSNGAVVRRDIVTYASGFVDRFEILKESHDAGEVRLTMRIWVSHSQIADRLLAKSEGAGQIDGNRATAQINSINRERASGDQAVALVLRDFPGKAFDVEVGQTNFTYDSRRRSVLEIPFTLKWNYSYVAALNEVLQRTAQNPDARICRSNCPHQRYIRVEAPRSGSRFTSLFGFDDYQKYDMTLNALVGSVPKLLLTLRTDSNEVAYQQCWSHPELDHVPIFEVPTSYMVDVAYNTISVNGAKVLKAQIAVPIAPDQRNLGTLSRVDLQIVRQNQCPNKS